LLSDHILLTINIVIIEEHVQTRKYAIVKNSREENKFLAELIESIKDLNMKHISSKEILEQTVKKFTDNIKKVCFKHLKIVNITKHLKS